jgi:hypothetical protein
VLLATYAPPSPGSTPVPVAVFDHQDLVGRWLPGGDMGIDLAAGDPESPLGVEIHLDRLRQQRVGRVEIDFKPVGNLERASLEFRVGVGDVFQVPLGQGPIGRANQR